MNTTWAVAVVAVLTLPAVASAEPFAGIALGRAEQSDSTVQTVSKSLFVGSRLRRNVAVRVSLESLAVEETCGLCTASASSVREGRSVGLAVQYRLVERGRVQPFVMLGVANESYVASYGSSTTYIRREAGVGVAVPLSPQIQLVGELRLGARDLYQQNQTDQILPVAGAAEPTSAFLYDQGIYNDGASFRSAHLGVVVSF